MLWSPRGSTSSVGTITALPPDPRSDVQGVFFACIPSRGHLHARGGECMTHVSSNRGAVPIIDPARK